jgi:hypothetical protein
LNSCKKVGSGSVACTIEDLTSDGLGNNLPSQRRSSHLAVLRMDHFE